MVLTVTSPASLIPPLTSIENTPAFSRSFAVFTTCKIVISSSAFCEPGLKLSVAFNLTKIGKSDICQECFKFSEDIETSEEAFKEIVEGALPKNYVESYKRIIQNMVKHISNNLASEIIAQKISKEMHIEYVKGTNKLVVNHWKI